jgi:thiol-disulfide isomerase/thioredoxin
MKNSIKSRLADQFTNRSAARVLLAVLSLILAALALGLYNHTLWLGSAIFASAPATPGAAPAESGRLMPDLTGAVSWLNSPPLTRAELQGKVVLIDFWTYSCINCLRSLPYLQAWHEKYKDSGLVVIGVHTPEFPFETDPANIQKALRRFGVTFPVAVDSEHAIWDAFSNDSWPAHYFIDAKGRIRFTHFGEGEYDRSEQWIRQLLAERNGSQPIPARPLSIQADGIQAAADWSEMESPETYLGFERAERFASPGGLRQLDAWSYTSPSSLALNQWSLSGKWIDRPQSVSLKAAPGRILFRFHARDLHLVLGPVGGSSPRFRILIDGEPPGADHGADCNSQGEGVVGEHRLYQLVRQSGAIRDRTFQIEFLDPGVEAFAFTFG